jgi:uncharacterized membrane protein
MIQKYAPTDLSTWGDWLIYGTALGVGKKVEKAMQSLNVGVADAGLPVGPVGMNYAFIPLIAFTPPSSGSSGGRGGFGGGFGGGGFGGGGAGGDSGFRLTISSAQKSDGAPQRLSLSATASL